MRIPAEVDYRPDLVMSTAARRLKEIESQKKEIESLRMEIDADDRNVNNLMEQVNTLGKELEAKDKLIGEIELTVKSFYDDDGVSIISAFFEIKNLIGSSCDHSFVSADNQAVTNAEICTKCKIVRAKEDKQQ